MMWLNSLQIVLAASFLLLGCGDDGSKATFPDPRLPDPDPVIIADLGQVDSPDGYSIVATQYSNGELRLTVERGGGCGTHDYAFYVSPDFMESFPVQVFAYLLHECDDPCDGIGWDELRFDPTPLLDRYRESYGRLDPIRIQVYTRPDRAEAVELLVEP